MAVIPTAKALYLCEETDVEGGSTNLYALIESLRPLVYPHVQPSFTCFTQLRGGLGRVPCHVDVRRVDDSRLVYTTNILPLTFRDREVLLQVAVHIEGCVFDSAGAYLVEWYCDNVWVADTALLLREIET